SSRVRLRKAQENVQRQPAQRICRVELLRHGNERRAVLVQDLDDPGKVQKRPGEPIDFVDYDAVDDARLNILEQPPEAWSVHGAARVAAVIVAPWRRHPALLLLAAYISLGGFALRVQRVECLIKSFFRRLARLDCAGHAPALAGAIPRRRFSATSSHSASP